MSQCTLGSAERRHLRPYHRLVSADGGNPDPTRTHGKDAWKAKEIELAGWDYSRQLKGHLFTRVAHRDAEGTAGPSIAHNRLTSQ